MAIIRGDAVAPSDYKSQNLNKNEAKKHIRFVLSKYPDSV